MTEKQTGLEGWRRVSSQGNLWIPKEKGEEIEGTLGDPVSFGRTENYTLLKDGVLFILPNHQELIKELKLIVDEKLSRHVKIVFTGRGEKGNKPYFYVVYVKEQRENDGNLS